MLATWLGTFSVRQLHLACSVSESQLQTAESSSQNSPVLIALPILPARLPAYQQFIKQVQKTNVYRVKPLPHSKMWSLSFLLLPPDRLIAAIPRA